MSDRVLDLQHELRNFLRAKEYFSDSTSAVPKVIEIIAEDMGDIDAKIDAALAQGIGACVVIRTPGGKIPSADTAIAVYNPATFRFRCYEHPARNRTRGGSRQSSGKIADAIVRFLWTFRDSVEGNPVVPRERIWGQENGVPFYDVLCETTLALDENEPTRTESLTDENGVPITGDYVPITG